jgi:hypothetical protein
MEPITIIVAALVGGAAATAKDVGAQAVKDAYNGLRALVIDKFGGQGDVDVALEQAQKKPDSDARQAVLKEELKGAGADRDQELVRQAQALLDLLKKHGAGSSTSYAATLTGNGAIAQGEGAVAAGKGGVAVGGNVHGGIRTREDK